MFDSNHYVPILRWKRAEWVALRNLAENIRGQVTPLIELVPRNFFSRRGDTFQSRLSKIIDDISFNWGNSPIFLDLGLVESTLFNFRDTHPIEGLFAVAENAGLSLISVVEIDQTPGYRSAIARIVKRGRRGVCIRLLRRHLRHPDLPRELAHLISECDADFSEVDLLVDYKVIDNFCPRIIDLTRMLPDLNRFRTFTLTSGAFTKDLSGFEKNRQHTLPRLDWIAWRDQVGQTNLNRKPTFGDYTIQYAIYEEPPYHPNVSASIRYTFDEYWVIMRGEGPRNEDGPGYAQYAANAQLLCERPEFCGPAFSYGDWYIHQLGREIGPVGNPEMLLRAGINHHISYVVQQISNLPEA